MVQEVIHRNALLKGSRLNEYIIEKVLGKPGGFGVAYLARDTNLDQWVAIKEYLPNDLAMREGATVHPKSTHDEGDFEWGLERFRDEAKTLAKFSHPNIVQVLRYFEANGTGYMVMRYEDGKPLNEILEKETLTEDELVQNILLPLLDGLKQVHAASFLHRDIKPGNIYMRRSDETPVLLDFGAARNALGSKSKSLTSIVTAGYAPFEQYHSDGNQGPWSDIYALGAVAYRIVTGNRPPEAPSRIRKDKMIPAVEAAKGKYSETILKAIDHALAMDEEDRPQNCEEWKRELTAQTSAEPSTKPDKVTEQSSRYQKERVEPSEESTGTNSGKHKEPSEAEMLPKKKGNTLKFFVGIAVLIVGVVIVQQMTQRSDEVQQTKAMQEQMKQEKARQQAEEIARNKMIEQERQKAEEQARKDEAMKLQQQRLAKEEAQKVAKEKARNAAVEKAKRAADKKRKLAVSIPKRPMTSVGQIAFSPDGSKVLYGSGRVIKLKDVNTGKIIGTFEGHKQQVNLVTFSPDGNWVLSGSYDKTVKLWNAKSRTFIRDIAIHSREIASIAFSSDGTKVISSGIQDRNFSLWDLIRKKKLNIFQESNLNPEWDWSDSKPIIFSPDGKKILSGLQNEKSRTLKLWSVKKGEGVKYFKFNGYSYMEIKGCLAGEEGGIDEYGILVHSVSFSLDGSKLLVSVGYGNNSRCQDEGQPNVFENVVHQFDVSSGKELFAYKGHQDESFDAAFSPDGSKVVSGGADRTIRIWDAGNGKLERTLKFEGDVYYVAFSPDGSKLVSWNENNIFRIIDLNKGTMRTFK